jgi:hypothetical protein
VTATNGIGATVVYSDYELIEGVQEADLLTNLVAHYKLDDHDGNTTIVATVGSAGSLVGGNNDVDLWVGAGGGPGGALLDAGLTFDGVADYVSFSQVTLTGAYTLAGWTKRPDTTSYDSLAGHSSTVGYYGWRNNTTRIQHKIPPYSGDAYFDHSVDSTKWQHCVFGRDSSGVGFIYLNSTPLSLTGGYTSTGDEKFNQIARYYINVGSMAIADTRIYSRTLSADDVAALHDLGKPQATTLPTMSGSPTVGSTVGLADEGNWTDGVTDFWQIQFADDALGTNTDYNVSGYTPVELTSDHLGKYVQVAVARFNDIGLVEVGSGWVGPIRAAGGFNFQQLNYPRS